MVTSRTTSSSHLIVMVTGCTTSSSHLTGLILIIMVTSCATMSSHLSGLLIVMVTGCKTELSPTCTDPHHHGYWLHNKRGPLLLEFILLDLVTVLDAHQKKEYPTCFSSSSSSRSRFWLCTIRRSCACRITGILVSISTVRASSDNSSPSFYGNRIRDH